MILSRHGVHLELPTSWSGRIYSRQGGLATLHAGNFPLALKDGQFGDSSTGAMRSGASFLALTEYKPGDGLKPGRGLFAARSIPLPLDPTSFSSRGLAHPRPGQAGTQSFFTAAGRPFCLYVVLSGPRGGRRHQLTVIDHVLRSLRIVKR